MTVAATCAINEVPRFPTCAITDTYEYDAFGNEFTVTGGSNTPNEMMYRGEQWDSDLGLYYLRARCYNPLTGRFMSRDPNDPGPLDSGGNPSDPKALHKYLYAGGDPVNMIDPAGREEEEEEGAYLDLGAATTGSVIVFRGLLAACYVEIAWDLYHIVENKETPKPISVLCGVLGLATGWGPIFGMD
jgi:RHS repeat-associated protein